MVGLFLWTLAEYNVHRFLFHLRPRSPWQERMVFLLHGIHHYQPHCKTRLVLPPALSVPMAAIFFALFYLILGVLLGASPWVAARVCRLSDRLYHLRYDPLRNAPRRDARPGTEVPQETPHVSPLQDAQRPLWRRAHRGGTTYTGRCRRSWGSAQAAPSARAR